ncbi:KIF-binding protein-like [Polyergus mexicanus]|uniref:KIF-binding protein-like n=1 Tax=Polyergus mexicanus TaxID=615972 RepID=UPI0038B597DB
MLDFLGEIISCRIEQIDISEKERKKEANTSEDVESMNVDASFLEILNFSFEMKHKKDKISKKMKKKINAIEVKMNSLFQNVTTSTEIEFDNIIALAVTYYNLGYMYIYKQENCHVGKDYLVRCMELLKGKELHRKAILIAIEVLIELSEVWKKLLQYENCYPSLEKAMELYINYTKEEDEYPHPINVEIIVCGEDKTENPKIFLADLHFITLEKIEELYCVIPRDKHKFVIYVHDLLTEQVTKGEVPTENEMTLFWAKTSADLCTYFLFHDRFIEAKVHLIAANYMIETYFSLVVMDEDSTEFSENRDNYSKILAHTCKLWGIYGIKLLRSSKERLLQYKSDKFYEANNIKSKSLAKSEEELMVPLLFIDLENEMKKFIIPYNKDTYISSLIEAKIVFTNILRWFDTAKVYYTVERYFLNHVEIIIGISEAYKYYAYFQRSQNEQIKVVKQHIGVLENAVNTVHSKHNTVRKFLQVKKINFKLAVAYSKLLDMRSEELDELEEITDEMRMETTQLIKNIIDNFNIFINH